MPKLRQHDFKRYYSIGEVAIKLRTVTSHLRFLEEKLKLKIKRDRKNFRQYTIDQVHYLGAIVYLTHSFGFKILGAKNYLELK